MPKYTMICIQTYDEPIRTPIQHDAMPYTYLPIEYRSLHVAYREFLFLADRRVVVFCRFNEMGMTACFDDDVLFFQMRKARSSSVRNFAVSGKSTRTSTSVFI